MHLNTARRPVAPGVPGALPAAPDGCEPLDTRGTYMGMGRSSSFPLPQWRDSDPYRTVFFDHGQERALVFLHGLGGNATHWEFVAPALSGHHRVLGMDFVGCGWSLKPDVRYTVDLLRDHVIDFLDRRGLKRVTLVGHSLGGAVALATALAQPGRVEALCMVCAPCLSAFPAYLRLGARAVLHRSLLTRFFLSGYQQIINGVFVDTSRDNRQVRWFEDTNLRDEPGYPNLRDFSRVAESLCLDVVGRCYADQLPRLHMPVLTLVGDHDRLTALPKLLRAMDRVRRVRTVVIPRAGHMPMIERPEETLFHLRRFLDDPPPPAW